MERCAGFKAAFMYIRTAEFYEPNKKQTFSKINFKKIKIESGNRNKTDKVVAA